MVKPIKKERNIKLDLMRFSGVLVIMIAHSHPPVWLNQLRNFGSPLLIFGSALTYGYIYKTRTIDSGPFFKKRLKRLIVPAWIFLTIFFGVVFVALSLIGKDFQFSKTEVVQSYFFYKGIGFVWIFKVYLILALITPFGLKWSKSKISNKNYFGLIFMVYLIYEVAIFLFFESIPAVSREFISSIFLVVIPYSALYLYGLRAHTLKNRQLHYVIFYSLLIFLVLAVKKRMDFGSFIQTQGYKYPPTLYYLSYAFFCINLFYYLVMNYFEVNKTRFEDTVVWLSTNSLWIYLWHILGYYIWGFLVQNRWEDDTYIFSKFLASVVFLLSFGVIFTYIQLKIVNKVWQRSNEPLRKFLVFFK